MRPKKQKPPDLYRRLRKTTRFGSHPLHERTFPRSLPRKRGRCREAIGMGFAHHCVYLNLHSHMILEIRQYPKVTVTTVAYILFVLSALVLAQTPRTAMKMNYGGRAGSQIRICSFGRHCVVQLHYPPIWNSPREPNPDLFVRTEASSCLRPREPN
jgi:hypothetical protein